MTLLDSIETALTRDAHWQSIHVPKALSREFALHDVERERRLSVITLLIGIVIFNSLVGVERIAIPDVFSLSVTIRLFPGAPLCLFLLWLIMRHTRSRLQHQLAGMAFAVGVSALCSAVIALSEAEAAPIYLTGNNMLLAYALGVFRPAFALAVATTGIILAIEIAAVMAAPFFSVSVLITTAGITLCTGTMLLYACWCLENARRVEFLSQKRDEIRLSTIAERNEALTRLADIDPLTELANRRGFDAKIQSALDDAPPDAFIAVAMIDIDNFKPFNDRYGHLEGDEALKRVAGALKAAAPANTHIGRVGGEEFAMTLVSLDPHALETGVPRLHEAVNALRIAHEGNDRHGIVTISVGMARDRVAQAELAALFALADEALYEAKAAGRNTTVVKRHRGAECVGGDATAVSETLPR